MFFCSFFYSIIFFDCLQVQRYDFFLNWQNFLRKTDNTPILSSVNDVYEINYMIDIDFVICCKMFNN
jgi:hypothetical protein